ncbi:MAG TPA: geranylgeranylglyceryl/heptaprenylglyceryl phosphate synthase [Chitinophagaceae bacterium]|nr:geranylgeranylglyceryl/heptaprenylglyceryl phosphate synthase [Chitinophagaceae bacterium]
MNGDKIYQSIFNLKKTNKKGFAVLFDPDELEINKIENLADLCNESSVDYIFIGGSIMLSNHLDECIQKFKQHSSIPIILFPGSPSQISKYADALFYLSLISGRNPELLIGAHVVSAPFVKNSGLEIIPTGYMIIDGGSPTTVSYMSHSSPIPHDKKDIAVCTAMAGEMQGKKVIYMDAGSGAKNPISNEMIEAVSKNIDIPLIAGGGIKSASEAIVKCKAGADIIVVGNAIENETSLIKELSVAIHQF